MVKKALLSLFFIVFSLASLAQQADALLSQFFATQLDEIVFMRWTISAGNTCDDTHIERSSDGISYEKIGLIGGICGSPNQSITYEFRDSVPLMNRVAYYRLLLGGYGHTSAQQVEFKQYNDEGFLLAPNPFTDFTRLSFDNESGEEFRLLLTGMNGQIALEKTTHDQEFIIHEPDLSAGIYNFRVINNGKEYYSGQLIKLKP